MPIAAPHRDRSIAREAVSTSWAEVTRADQLFNGFGGLHLRGESMQELFEPLYAAARKDRSITAWVAASDVIGSLALDFLQRRASRRYCSAMPLTTVMLAASFRYNLFSMLTMP